MQPSTWRDRRRNHGDEAQVPYISLCCGSDTSPCRIVSLAISCLAKAVVAICCQSGDSANAVPPQFGLPLRQHHLSEAGCDKDMPHNFYSKLLLIDKAPQPLQAEELPNHPPLCQLVHSFTDPGTDNCYFVRTPIRFPGTRCRRFQSEQPETPARAPVSRHCAPSGSNLADNVVPQIFFPQI